MLLKIETNRSIDKFKGECAIIGCSCELSILNMITDKKGESHHQDHKNSEDFYSIDFMNKKADYIIDVKSNEFSKNMANQFNFIWLECLPPECYFSENASYDLNSGIHNALKENGVLLIQGRIPEPSDPSINSENCQIYTNSYKLSTDYEAPLKKGCLAITINQDENIKYKFLTPDNTEIIGQINKNEFTPLLKKLMGRESYQNFKNNQKLPTFYESTEINVTNPLPIEIKRMILKKENIPVHSSCIIIKGDKNIDPNLIIKSLNKNAQKAILNEGIDINILTLDVKYDKELSFKYVHNRSLELIDNQIKRLDKESLQLGNSFFDQKQKLIKAKKITALGELKKEIEKSNQVSSIINSINNTYPELLSGTLSHKTKDCISSIMEMEQLCNDKFSSHIEKIFN
ncbi:MAG: hypothetical protein HYX60_06350 [Legionella longbeachae]|nr:hypothetical protein [Legionella longbeachae]